MRINACILPIQGVINCTYWTLRAGGRTYITMLFDSVFTWVVLVPIAWLLIHKTALPLPAVFLLVNSAELIKLATGLILIRRGVWVRNIVADKA